MKYILCSEGYKKFFDTLQDNVFMIEDMLTKIKEALPLLADEIYLGRLETRLIAPATVYEPAGKNDAIVFYCREDGYEDTPYYEEFHTGENGSAVFVAHPQKGHVWTEDELSAVKFLMQNIFFMCGRTRLMGLMKKAVITDNMTGALNNVGLMQFAGILQARGQLSGYVGLFLNIKNFKYINQRAGSGQGDILLKKYYYLIQNFLLTDEVCAHLGGDNFFILIKKKRLDDFLQLISDVKISVTYNNVSISFDIMARIGMYSIEENDSMSDVISRASIALAHAKKTINQNYVWFTTQMLAKTLHDKEISNMFPQAIKNREFIVYYQPKVNLSDNSLCGCEALVRWVRNGVIVPPLDFIPVLEHEGSICTLDFYVLDTACRDIRKWLDAGIEPVRVSVNFSKVHLHNQKLAEDILAVLDKYHIASKYIEVELTEMSGYEDFEALSTFVNIMKDHGINTSIDDFGTGYSSLNLLKDLNVDIIKLDKSFLHNITEKNKSDEIVIKTIINMIRELNMDVIAEGVETFEQAEFLTSMNCRMAQGFLFDKPLPRDDFEHRLTCNRVYTFAS